MAMIESVNEADMSHRCRQLVDVNTLKGSDSPNVIPVQSDGIYNNPLYPLYSGVGETPLQPATQTVYSFAENVTNKHKIIKVITKSKMCCEHSHLATYLLRALQTTTAVLRCVGQIYQCITPLVTSLPWQGRGWLNSCAKMASRSVR